MCIHEEGFNLICCAEGRAGDGPVTDGSMLCTYKHRSPHRIWLVIPEIYLRSAMGY